ncbi:DNA primase [Fusicatenibacter faecihominis]|uniref:DNA primase n=1 Tax=Fusicatenibacter faecihominis TaxID=2881276 RepID=A0AAE3DTD1_9FIRM|nr:DNA primase [Fusicatenibacter faecihominis]MCC2190054.1 DNA primase [Fusicatenibacter faecihominis]
MYYAEDVIEEVRSRNDIVSVISEYVKLQRKGSSYFGLCPFHNEKSPSFSVSPDKQMYYCFGCGAGGNVFTFIQEYENYSFPEAMKFLAERAGITLPEKEYSQEERRAQDLRTRILNVNKMTAKYYYYQLRTENGRQAMEYLKNRCLSDETIRSFGLGYSNKYSNDLYLYLKKQGVSDELLRESGLMNVDERNGMYDKFWNRVIFPIMDVNNRVIGFGGRVMGDGKPKYLNSPETAVFDKSRNLYGLNVARTARKKSMLVCEGYMDVISMHQAGFKNSVASLGTALTTQHASLLKRYTDEVILTYDSDGAGIKAALRAIPMLKAAGISTRVLHMNPYKDPDEFIKTLGPEAFQERMDQAENSFLFEISILERDFDMHDPEGKTGFYQAVARKLMEFDQELERENYIQAVAERYQISFDSLRKMVNREAMRGAVPRREREEVVRPQKKREKEDGKKTSQRLLLTWLIEQKGLYEKISAYITPEDFTDPLYREVAEKLFEQLKTGEVNPARILSAYEDAEQQREVAALFNATVRVETKAELEKALNETILRVLRGSIEYRTAHLDPADMAGLQKIVADKRRVEAIGKLHISLD